MSIKPKAQPNFSWMQGPSGRPLSSPPARASRGGTAALDVKAVLSTHYSALEKKSLAEEGEPCR